MCPDNVVRMNVRVKFSFVCTSCVVCRYFLLGAGRGRCLHLLSITLSEAVALQLSRENPKFGSLLAMEFSRQIRRENLNFTRVSIRLSKRQRLFLLRQ